MTHDQIDAAIDAHYQAIKVSRQFSVDAWQQIGSAYLTAEDVAKRKMLPTGMCQWCEIREAMPSRRSCHRCAESRPSLTCPCGREIRHAGRTHCGRCRLRAGRPRRPADQRCSKCGLNPAAPHRKQCHKCMYARRVARGLHEIRKARRKAARA